MAAAHAGNLRAHFSEIASPAASSEAR